MAVRGRIIQAGGARRPTVTAVSNRPPYDELFVEPWDDHEAGRVERGAGGAALEADTTHSVFGDNADGVVKSAKITTGAADTGIIIYSKNLVGAPIDLSAFTHCIIDYRVSYTSAAHSADVANLRFFASSNTANPTADVSTFNPASAADNVYVQPGKHRLVAAVADFGAFNGTGAWAAIRSLYARLDKRTAATYLPEAMTFEIDRMMFVTATPPSRPRLALTFDDGHEHNLAASQWLDTVGIRGTFYINTKYAILGESPITAYAGDPAMLTFAEMRDMQSRGHLIGNHTHTHLELNAEAQFDTDDEDEYVADVLRAREILIDEGLSRGADLLAAPGGEASITKGAVDTLLGGVVRQIRGASTGVSVLADGGYRQPSGWLDPRLPRAHSLSELEAGLTAEADAVIAEHAAGNTHATRITVLHATELASAGARGGLTYWAAKRDAGLVDIVTMDQLLA